MVIPSRASKLFSSRVFVIVRAESNCELGISDDYKKRRARRGLPDSIKVLELHVMQLVTKQGSGNQPFGLTSYRKLSLGLSASLLCSWSWKLFASRSSCLTKFYQEHELLTESSARTLSSRGTCDSVTEKGVWL